MLALNSVTRICQFLIQKQLFGFTKIVLYKQDMNKYFVYFPTYTFPDPRRKCETL